MPATRVMNGVADQTGAKVNTLRVRQMVSRNPRPRYRTVCEQCGTESTASHAQIVSGAARCLSSTCGKPSQKRDSLAEQRRLVTELEAERLRAEREASSRRMEADTEGYERPERYSPTPEKHRIMSERERLSVREFREAEEAQEREHQRPILEAERKAEGKREASERAEQTRKEKWRAFWAECVTTDPDPQFHASPELIRAKMPEKKAAKFSYEEAEKFVRETPEYLDFKSDESSKAITAYLERNGARIVDASMFKAAFNRLRDLGILKKNPPKTTTPAPTPRRINLDFSPEQALDTKQPVLFDGVDEDGNPCQYTERQVDRMSSDQMKRRLRLTKERLALPGYGPGPGGPQ